MHHVIQWILSFRKLKLQYFPPNTTSKLQPLDQGIIRAFKAHYRKYLVKHIIACCAMAQTPDDIKITCLDAIYWIDAAWRAITDATICNTFCTAADIVTVTGDEQCEELEKLDDLLQHVTIGGQTMKASDFIELDKDIPPFNIWFDNCERLMASDLIEFNDDDEIDDEDDRITTESSQKYRKQWK
ncbi:unnamed protein product [Rotaria sordida]|uniref:DDE-1 domain-containing protein n=1 Tax=Rotaria sordida TaxID=392033 RepID=A0A820AQ39_9BILA|nr:unnamed protein product [Rotaria sordida]CAF4188980.1 unnamed protein product [Rotaria sordida]CAF4211488.1 unnamed protein product [Rotaria sordida]